MKEKLEKFGTPFTQIANAVLRDKALSWKAKGIFAYIYSKPDGWDFAVDRISEDSIDGIESTRSGIQELEKLFYLQRKRQSNGRVKYFATYKPPAGKPKEVKTQTGVSRGVSNTDLKSNKEKEKEATQALPLPKANSFFGKDKDGGVQMSLEEFVLMCRHSEFRNMHIIADYAEMRKPNFTQRGQWRAFGLRNMRVAKRIAPYNDRQIDRAIEKLSENLKKNGGFITKWTLETLEKHLEEV